MCEFSAQSCTRRLSAAAAAAADAAADAAAGCRLPPASSQAGAGLAAVHTPALHNEAASQTSLPPDTLQPSPARRRPPAPAEGNGARTKLEGGSRGRKHKLASLS